MLLAFSLSTHDIPSSVGVLTKRFSAPSRAGFRYREYSAHKGYTQCYSIPEFRRSA